MLDVNIFILRTKALLNMILEFAFVVFLLTSPISPSPQILANIISQDGDSTGSVFADAELPDCIDSLPKDETQDISFNSQYPKRTLDSVGNSDVAWSLEDNSDQVTTPLTFDRAGARYADTIAIEPEPMPECIDSHPFCCSFNDDKDQFGEKSLHEDYDCFDPTDLKRTGKDCYDQGATRPNQIPWRKRWHCCKDRVKQKHRIGDETRETWIGLQCDKKNVGNGVQDNAVPANAVPAKKDMCRIRNR